MVAGAVEDAAGRGEGYATVTAAHRDGRLTVTVEDDGQGRSASMTEIADRVGALGGILTVEPTWIGGGDPVRVVVADDVMLTREGIVRLLRRRGHRRRRRGRRRRRPCSGRSARQQPDVAVVDIQMPPTHTDEGLVAAAGDPRGPSGDRRPGPVPVRRTELRHAAHPGSSRTGRVPAQGTGVRHRHPWSTPSGGSWTAKRSSTRRSSPASLAGAAGPTRSPASPAGNARSWRSWPRACPTARSPPGCS